MRKTKKILAVILAISMIAVYITAIPVSAATLTDPEKLAAMNLFRGDTADGLTPQYLAKAPDRKTAARLLLRFNGLEEAADAYTGTATFSDATSATVYWQPMIGYLKANPGAGFGGYEDGTFRPNDAMTAQAFYKVLLTILGYKQDTDFTWAQTFTFAASKGMTKIASKTGITNADVATAMVEALNATTKTGDKLITALINDGVVTATQAAAAGFNVISTVTGYETAYTMAYGGANPLPATVTAVYQDGNTASVAVAWGSFSTTVEGTYDVTGTIEGFGTITTKVTLTKTLMVTDAYPTGTREIYVTFNMPVPTTTAVTCKFGTAVLAGLTQTWSSDRKSLTIKRGYNYTPGNYSVTVSASTKEFRIEAEKLVEIDIAANTVYPQTGNQDLNVTFYNQYGLAMNPLTMNLQLTAFSPDNASATLTLGRTVSSLNMSGVQALEVGDTITMIVADNATAVVSTKILTVSAAPVISSFTFGELTIADSATILLTGTHGHKMTVSAVDQYGNEYKLRTGNQDISSTISATTPLFITSTDPAVVDPALIEVDADGKLFFKPGAIGTKDGTVTLRVIAPMNPNMTPVSYSITVQKPATISSISVQGLSSTLRAGQWVPLIAYAYDQYNKPISMENINNLTNLGKLRIVSTNSVVIPNGTASDSITGIRYNTTTKVLEVYGASAGLTGISILYDNIIQATLTVNVEEAAAPSQLTAVNLPTVFQKTAYADMTLDNFTIYDQYYSLIGLSTGYRIEISGTAGLTVAPSVLTSTNGTTRITAPNTVGNYDLIFSLKDPSGNTLSTQSMVITVIDSAAVTSYQIEPISNVYAKIETNGSLADKTAYYKPINIVGRTSSGISVQLVYDPATGLPADILMITSTNNSFSFVVHNGKKHLTTTYDSTASSISTTIKIFTGQGEVGSTTVTASSVAPYMHNVYFEQTSITLSRSSGVTKDFLDYLKAKDQYGVNYVLGSANIYYMTTNSSIISVDNTADTFTLVATGACTLRAYFAATDRTVEMNVNVIN
ncbi:MAG: Ig-like domain-containing protein [Clostridia bacterium]|nr:Ig-like domain-containing protein [Clostridia bacterium]